MNSFFFKNYVMLVILLLYNVLDFDNCWNYYVLVSITYELFIF